MSEFIEITIVAQTTAALEAWIRTSHEMFGVFIDNIMRDHVYCNVRQMWLYGTAGDERRQVFRSTARCLGYDLQTARRLFPLRYGER